MDLPDSILWRVEYHRYAERPDGYHERLCHGGQAVHRHADLLRCNDRGHISIGLDLYLLEWHDHAHRAEHDRQLYVYRPERRHLDRQEHEWHGHRPAGCFDHDQRPERERDPVL